MFVKIRMENKVEPLRGWPSPAAIAAHKKNGGRWLCEETMGGWIPPIVKVGVFYEDDVFMVYGKTALSSVKFGTVDENYNRMPWPTDGEGNPL